MSAFNKSQSQNTFFILLAPYTILLSSQVFILYKVLSLTKNTTTILIQKNTLYLVIYNDS